MPITSAKNLGLTGQVGPDLGFGQGDLLPTQLADETEEQRRRRLLQQQQREALMGRTGVPNTGGSPAVQAIFGGMGGAAIR